MRLSEQIGEGTLVRKQCEMRDRMAAIKLQLDAVNRSHVQTAGVGLKVFELQPRRRKSLSNQKKALRHPRRRAFRFIKSE